MRALLFEHSSKRAAGVHADACILVVCLLEAVVVGSPTGIVYGRLVFHVCASIRYALIDGLV